MLKREHALNRFTGSQTPTFGHRRVCVVELRRSDDPSATVAGTIPVTLTSDTTTTDSTQCIAASQAGERFGRAARR